MQAASDDAYLDRLGAPPSSLVFIMGAHRSGTSFLHHLLARTGRFNHVSAYDVVEYDRLLANRILGREDEVKRRLGEELGRLGDRGLDGIPVGVDHPEEYGFVLNLDLYGARITPETLPRFRQLCAKRRWLLGDDRPLLLKEPSEMYGNIGYLHAQFPEARMLFIHRHPLRVLDSQVRSWRTALEARSHYGSLLSRDYERVVSSPEERARYQAAYNSVQGAEWVLEYLIAGFDHYLEQIERLPRDRVLVETYETICASPRRYFARVSKFLGVDLPEPEVAFVSPRRLEVSPRAQAAYDRHVERLRDYLEHLDYPEQPED
jgi:hypothetical protein